MLCIWHASSHSWQRKADNSLAEISKVVFIVYKDSFNMLLFAGRCFGVSFFSSLISIRISLGPGKITS